jgi:hypothetical protein
VSPCFESTVRLSSQNLAVGVEFEGNHVLCPTQSEICVVIRKTESDIYIRERDVQR